VARKKRAKGEDTSAPGHPLLRVLTADIVLRAGSYALRQAVRGGLVRGKAADVVPDHPPSISARVLTAAASTLATRSVPGALLVGTGLLARTLYRRGMARREERLGRVPGASGSHPPI
jgi:hypothetical protein